MLVISVTTKLHIKVTYLDTLSQYMKVLGMLVISVTTKPHRKTILEDTLRIGIRLYKAHSRKNHIFFYMSLNGHRLIQELGLDIID